MLVANSIPLVKMYKTKMLFRFTIIWKFIDFYLIQSQECFNKKFIVWRTPTDWFSFNEVSKKCIEIRGVHYSLILSYERHWNLHMNFAILAMNRRFNQSKLKRSRNCPFLREKTGTRVPKNKIFMSEVYRSAKIWVEMRLISWMIPP